MMADARDHNRKAWNELARKRQRLTRPARDDDFANPMRTLDASGWLKGGVQGKRVLCLAAGGGKHGPLYAAAGAVVTVVDISSEMLRLDRQVAQERGLTLRTVEASMDDLSMLDEAEYDVVIHPVSTCYLPAIVPVYQQVSRVCHVGALYISQHKQPTSLQASIEYSSYGYTIMEPYYRSLPLPPVAGSRFREEGTHEYLHRWEEMIGGLCRAGFVIEDVVEPKYADARSAVGSFSHRSHYIAPYIRIKARRIGRSTTSKVNSSLWLP